ncbi:hypothetical protein [Ponticoccus alexandrii]|uniref:SH3 domain-containing protein n=1 Tax=Ponticoccus alexandrii TaxID=1943633 RepID=A0ABX7F7D5_9RHOB|nr:hypothetical protein [Ponticoccus alexandrii]QRF66298.1 hypothetical protein GQA70_08250 [Ponticoccus alexandrii]
MKRSLMTALVLVTAVSGCGQMRSIVGNMGGGNAPPSQLPAPNGGAAASLAEPAPGDPIVPRKPVGWRDSLRRDIPYVNMTSRDLPIYKEADRSAKAGTLSPGMGGYVETCSDAAPVCKIRYGANGASGWVRMDQMGGVAN